MPRVSWVCSFVTLPSLFLFFSLVSFLVVFRAFLSSRVLPLVVAFYFVLFCYLLFQVRVRSTPGAHTFSVVPVTAFRLLHKLSFGSGSQLFKVLSFTV